MASILAPPPIQLPAKAAIPRHTASGPVTPINSGQMAETINKANGPPIITPTVPVKNIITALLPKPAIALISMLSVNNTKQAGNRKYFATSSTWLTSALTIPNVFNNEGNK